MLQVLTEWTFLPWIRPRAPEQRRRGPGGGPFCHKKVIAHSYRDNSGVFWIFEPSRPKPAKAPVVIIFPGWGALHPVAYQAWIDHLVRKGNLVIFPVFQRNLLEFFWNFTPNAAAIVREALRELKGKEHVAADLRKVAFVGHSAGGVVSANLAADWKKLRLPRPSALMCIQPGGGTNGKPGIPLSDYSKISQNTLMLSIAGEDDAVVYQRDAIRIYRQATNIPKRNRNYVLFRTDRHGYPWVHSGHFSPCSIGRQRVHAVDYFGYWKLLDGLCDAAFHGKNRQYALGNTRQQRYMGTWSDGVPVRELDVIDDPKDL